MINHYLLLPTLLNLITLVAYSLWNMLDCNLGSIQFAIKLPFTRIWRFNIQVKLIYVI